MNKEHREALYDVMLSLDDAISQLVDIISDEQDAYDNLPSGLQCGRTGDSIQNAIERMDGFILKIESVNSEIQKMAKNK